MVDLTAAFGQLSGRRVLVAGDFILDRYTVGRVHRVSPEAPVVILNVTSEEQRPGGAGNVALNLVSLGAEVALLGRVGKDSAGEQLSEVLSAEGIDTQALYMEPSFVTPLKNRILAGGQQVVRVDYERAAPLESSTESKMIQELPRLLRQCAAVALSDYGKGSLTPKLIRALIDEARLQGVPVVVDPKGIDFARYSGATVLKPNLAETYAAAGCSSDQELQEVVARLLKKVSVDLLMVTRSEEGISLFYPDGGALHYPVKAVEVKDVTGAGDTVLAVVALSIACGLGFACAASLANMAASIAIEHVGCMRVTRAMLGERLSVR